MKVLVAQLCPTFCDSMDYSPSGFSVHGIFQQEYWSGLSCPLPGDLPKPGIKCASPALAGGFFTAFTEVCSDQYPSCPLQPRTEACYLKRRKKRE